MKYPRLVICLALAVIAAASAQARQPQRGYRGFVEWSNSIGTEGTIKGYSNGARLHRYEVTENTFYTGITTSHGYQINPMFFVGLGAGIERCGSVDNWSVPVFVQGRAEFKFGKYTPFGDIRLGANMTEGVGMYFAPTIGYRFNWGRRTGLNLGLGLTLCERKIEVFETIWETVKWDAEKRRIRPYFSFRLGVDF